MRKENPIDETVSESLKSASRTVERAHQFFEKIDGLMALMESQQGELAQNQNHLAATDAKLDQASQELIDLRADLEDGLGSMLDMLHTESKNAAMFSRLAVALAAGGLGVSILTLLVVLLKH